MSGVTLRRLVISHTCRRDIVIVTLDHAEELWRVRLLSALHRLLSIVWSVMSFLLRSKLVVASVKDLGLF